MTAQNTQEMAALYSLGMLETSEIEAVQHLLRSGDTGLDADIQAFQTVTGALGSIVPATQPPASLRSRLFDRIGKPSDAPVKKPKPALPAGLAALAHANDMPWRPTAFPGIRQKRLFTNTSDGTTVWLVNMDAGSFYPPHHHTSIEHTFVVSGDIVFDGYSLVAGEYQAALPDTDHDKPITTKNGCTVLIINNANDEVFAMPSA